MPITRCSDGQAEQPPPQPAAPQPPRPNEHNITALTQLSLTSSDSLWHAAFHCPAARILETAQSILTAEQSDPAHWTAGAILSVRTAFEFHEAQEDFVAAMDAR